MKSTSSTRLRWSVVRAIFGKEMLETLRDRRTLFLLIAIPMIFYPLLLVLITEVTLSQTEKIQARRGLISVTGAPLPEALRELVERGHRVLRAISPFGGYQAISWDPEQRVFAGASESRKDGQAAGF